MDQGVYFHWIVNDHYYHVAAMSGDERSYTASVPGRAPVGPERISKKNAFGSEREVFRAQATCLAVGRGVETEHGRVLGEVFFNDAWARKSQA